VQEGWPKLQGVLVKTGDGETRSKMQKDKMHKEVDWNLRVRGKISASHSKIKRTK